jgi:hypothetical protein
MDNTINSLVSKTVGVTDQQIRDFLANSPTDEQIVKAMEQYGVSPTQLATVVGMPEGQVVARIAATVPPGQTVIVGDTRVAPQYQTTGTGENQQIGGLENVYVEKVPTSDVNYKSPVGTPIQVYSPNGELVNTIKIKEDQSFFGGLKDALTDPVVLAALGGAAYGGLLGGAGTSLGSLGAVGSDLAGLSGIPAGAGALTAAETAALYGTGGAAGLGGAGVIGSDLAGLSGIPAGTGALTAAETAALAGTGGAGAAGLMGTGTGLTAAGAGGLGAAGTGAGLTAGTAGLGAAGTGAGLGAAGTAGLGAGLGSTLGGLATGVGAGALGSTLGSLATGVGAGALGSTLGAGAGSALGTTLGQGLGLSALGTGLGGLANQAGITEARNLINQYGTQAGTNLATAYQNAQGLNVANRTDLGNIFNNASTNMQNLYNQQVGYQDPYQNIGRAGSQGLLANQDYLTRQFGAADLNANLAPNYAFQLQQGQMANQRAANMGGGSLGGNALQGLQRYTQDYAGGAYQNAFNNFNTQRQNIYGNLSNMAQLGTTSAGQLANLGNQYGSNMGSLASNYGGNLTTGYGQGIGAANAYGLNTANLATGIGGALASNAAQTGANNATMLSNLGNTALLGSMLKAT